jgi:hypothetical protein
MKMSKSARTCKAFGIYLWVNGALLIVVPNFSLWLVKMPPTSEVWIRVVGLTISVIGVFAWLTGKHEIKLFMKASVYTRWTAFAVFVTFALLGLAAPQIALFGLADLLGGAWTYFAMKADARAESA